ncbi:hypothetical protein [Pseudomonas chlororaphis]|uniref:Uncharacterized protein n=1 Tax=Pseudomonas chlororaphis TaxID=587753 RepID=A0AAX3G4U0_9PSED|nr:hypothetical protein [Pseudomonas chlororaphis]AZC37150.1 diguanylate cyclase/phosphodiesterase [Pseudomonas chlororaphis subsp. piscium]AZC43696.1 diguanylate cyclase/phosphodiesterase [Pseudomonas chlororaphis subsp. piscium]AZC63144.1 diguanylate cyclase/phosphodiesterase [Pseudomonas chlororaphis subsp. piscium]AZC69375.1 diguanylate cyclase/phosphodiesterase [Pseudomonas chlororaphis subsp. piscium]AZC95410.1 diguanylate cyclase/phosphodiesterase [Pseudomonas chlororaphis subsp. pisciu
MDNSNGSGNNLVLWLPGSALILSLVVSTFALTREPFLEPRPIGAQFQAQSPIEARLWQDPFDALERYRKKFKEGNKPPSNDFECSPKIAVSKPLVLDGEPQQQPPEPPQFMVALVEGGPYADEVELRRRIRYAILAGFKNSRMVPEDEQHIRCLTLADDLSDRPITSQAGQQGKSTYAEIPYETFIANPFDPPRDMQDKPRPSAQTILLWVKQEHLGSHPLQQLEALRRTLQSRLHSDCGPPQTCPGVSNQTLLKVIGPSTSKVLLGMYRDEANGHAKPDIEIYSPLATADYDTLIHALGKPSPGESASQEQTAATPKTPMKLLRTVSDDGVMTRLLLDELKLRHVDPVAGMECSQGALLRVGTHCGSGGWQRSNRIALVSEWDSFYSRALIESFKSQVAKDADLDGKDGKDQAAVNDWVLRFSYLRGMDGRLPEEAASANKAPATEDNKNSKDKNTLDLSPLEKSDGNSQLDYLRRLADHIAREDEVYRRNGTSGIGAIGVLGADTYDKLLVLQALKGRMPNKVFFSTNLDARMLQRGQAQTTRNLVLAAPYGLTLTRALQQDVPPFRDSLQSAVFIAVLAAQAPQPYDAKRAKFDYSKSELLSPGIYEVGISGFIPLSSKLSAERPKDCAAPGQTRQATHDIMALRCLQDPSPSPYPELSQPVRDKLDEKQSFFWAGPLTVILLVLVTLLGWWWTYVQSSDDELPAWVRSIPLTLYVVSGLSAWLAMRFWRVEFMWTAFVLILLGIVCSELIRRHQPQPAQPGQSPVPASSGLFDASAWYVVVPVVVFVLALLWMYQSRRTLTDNGLGEPMFLFEGISAWPTVALRLLAVIISITALAWGWRNLRINSVEIEKAYHLDRYMSGLRMSLWGLLLHLVHKEKGTTLQKWRAALGRCLFLILFPLSTNSRDWSMPQRLTAAVQPYAADKRRIIFVTSFWKEHCVGGTFGARMLRALLATWIFVVATSALFVLWPMEGAPTRGESPIWMWNWLLPTLAFQLLVFWVVDANLLLTRFIRNLSKHYAIWPKELRKEHQRLFGVALHPCIDDWVDMQLIAKRTATVNRLIYAPTVVMLILIASRNSVFDNWPTPPSIVITFLLTTLILLASALSLRRAAEKARGAALQRLDNYLLEITDSTPVYSKLKLIRGRIDALDTGAFSRYSQEPLVRALLLSLTGVGGSLIVDALNYAKF